MTKKLERARLTCEHLEEFMYLHEVWPKVREWTAPRRLAWCIDYMSPTRAHTHINTHTQYTKNPLGRIAFIFVVTNNKYQ